VSARIRVQVIQAWPRRHEAAHVTLPEDATVAEAITAAGLTLGDHTGMAIYGETVTSDHRLRDGDRIELLRSLVVDPKEARRRRAGK
jgi:uncharacterized protein